MSPLTLVIDQQNSSASTNSTPDALAMPFFVRPGVLLRLEGLTVFLGAIALYANLGGNGWLFLALLLAPDLAMIGYLRGTVLGALTYNLVHAYPLPTLLMAGALAGGWSLGVLLALIWFAHIGMDRTVGYGLKYADAFKHTHMDVV